MTYLVYSRYYVTILKEVFLKGSGLAELSTPILALVVYAVAVMRSGRPAPSASGWIERGSCSTRIFAIVVKEFLELKRDKWARFRLIVPPLVQMLVFGYAATFEVYHVSTVVLDLDHSQESRELISRFTFSAVSTS